MLRGRYSTVIVVVVYYYYTKPNLKKLFAVVSLYVGSVVSSVSANVIY